MSILKTTKSQLKSLSENFADGLVLIGCGGPLNKWQDDINEMLEEENILLDGTKFEDIYEFEYAEDVTCLLFPFTNDVKLQIGKLAMWRLRTHNAFNGTWLSDFIHNKIDSEIA